LTSHQSPATGRGFFVTGTDTGVGKTLVTCALLHAFAARGARVVGMKPVAAGARQSADGLRNDDVEQILAAGNVAAPRQLVNPYCFEPPIAPHIAAREAGIEIEFQRIEHAYRELTQLADVVIVEGAGGFYVPLNARENTADLAQRLGLPVLLVVGIRLGCLNHALLTAPAVHACGLALSGWVANHVDSQMAHADANVAALTERFAMPPVAHIGFSFPPDPRRIAADLDLDRLCFFR
jgi:dethiobiotin synthetase